MGKKYKVNGTVEEQSSLGSVIGAIILIVIALAICGAMGK
jgi:hypothetical protein